MQIEAQIDEIELIKLCKQGDDKSYTLLYHKYAKGIFNTIYRMVLHTGEAEDLLQEVFVDVFRNISNYRDYGNFGSWIKRIAINKTISLLRKRRIVFIESEILELPDEIFDETAFDFTVEEVIKAIQLLPVGYRTIVQLYLLENIQQDEIAKLLGISAVTVRTQYHRARKKILCMLKERGLYD